MADPYWYPLSLNALGDEEIAAATDVLRSGYTTMGEKVEQFEEEFARYVGAPYAAMVNSGSSADLLAARACDLQDAEVIVPCVTWPTHVWAWEHAGASVKFCDVDGVNTTAELIADKITDRTRGISIPHLMGIPVDITGVLDLLRHHGDWVLHEDCCEALGSYYKGYRKPVGAAADVSSWSFFFSHQLNTMEGGMVTTTHRDVDRKVRSLRSHGWNRHFSADKYTFCDEGYNLRPTEVSAAIGLVQLTRLDAMNAARQQNHNEFVRALRGTTNIELPEPPEGTLASWFGQPMFVKSGRDELAKHLEGLGVETRPILAGNLKSQPGFRGFYFGKTPGGDRVTTEGLFVGLHHTPDTGAFEVARIIAGLQPVIAVCSIFRNSVPYIPRYFAQVEALDDVRLVLTEGDSSDHTLAELKSYLRPDDSLEVVEHGGPHFGSVDNPQRWDQIAAVVRPTVRRALDLKPDTIVWVESDLLWQPATLERLVRLAQGKSVAPMAMAQGEERFYDIWGYRLNGKHFLSHVPYLPTYPGCCDDNGLVPIDSCGSCFATQEFGTLARWSGHWPFKSSNLWLDQTVATEHP